MSFLIDLCTIWCLGSRRSFFSEKYNNHEEWRKRKTRLPPTSLANKNTHTGGHMDLTESISKKEQNNNHNSNITMANTESQHTLTFTSCQTESLFLQVSRLPYMDACHRLQLWVVGVMCVCMWLESLGRFPSHSWVDTAETWLKGERRQTRRKEWLWGNCRFNYGWIWVAIERKGRNDTCSTRERESSI